VTLFNPYIGALSYNRGKKSGNPRMYQFLAESGWDLGAMGALFSASALLYCGSALRPLLLLAIPGLIGLFVVSRVFSTPPGKLPLCADL